MTMQYAILPGQTGQTGLTAKLFASEESDTVLYTSDSMTERTNAKGQFRFTFGESVVIPAGDYFGIVTTSGGVVVSTGWRTFAGTDGETATTTPPTVELDSDARVKLDATQPDYAPLKASDYTAPANSDISAIRAKTDNLPSDPADQSLVIDATNAVMARIGAPAGASMSADIAAVKTDTGNLVSRITANLFSGITYLSRWLGVFAGKTADSTTLSEINATTAGVGFNNTTDSLEAIRDRGDAAWTTGGGGGSEAAVLVSTTIATLSSQTVFTLTAGSADNDVYNDQLVVITDSATSTQKCRALVSDYVGSTKTLTLASTPGFTIATGDSIAIIAVAGLTAAQRNQLALIGAGTRMTVRANLGTEISLKIGDTYSAARSTAKRIDVNDSDASIYDMLTGDEVASIDFGLSNAKTIDVVTGTVDPETVTHTAASGSVSAYTTVYVEVEVDKALSPFCGDYDIQITYDDETRYSPFGGKCELVRDFKA